MAKAAMDKRRSVSTLFYLYALLIFLGTVMPLVTSVSTPLAYYIVTSVLFALFHTALLLRADQKALKTKCLLMMLAALLLVALISFWLKANNFWYLLLLWLLLLPVCLWLANRFKAHNAYYYLLHIGMILLMMGVLLSSGFCREEYRIKPASSPLIIDDHQISMEDLEKEEFIVISTIARDTILLCSNRVKAPDGSIIIPVLIKPMILLFWIGGFATIGSPMLVLLIQACARRKQTRLAHL